MASVREHRGKFQVRWRVGPQERSQVFEKRREAERFASQVETDMARGEYLDPRAGLATVEDYSERWMDLRRGLARSTRDRDRSYLRAMILPTFGSIPVASVRTSDVDSWIASIGETRKLATVRLARGILQSVFELARRDLAVRINPVSDAVMPKQVRRSAPGRALSDDELSRILEAAESTDTSKAAIVWLMARADLRIGEALALRRSDLDFRRTSIEVVRSMSRREGPRPVKGRKSEDEGRTVPMPEDLADRLRTHIEDQVVSPLDGLLFTTADGSPLRYDNWRARKWLRIVKEAGVGELRPHDLRHTAATRLYVVDRWTPPEVQAFLGHSDPSLALRIYAHINTAELPTPSILQPFVGR